MYRSRIFLSFRSDSGDIDDDDDDDDTMAPNLAPTYVSYPRQLLRSDRARMHGVP